MSWRNWRRGVLALGLALGLFPACFAQSFDVAKDPRLQKNLSVKLKIVPLPDALKQLSKLTGVKLQAMSLISDLKVTVLVGDMPAGVVLDKIAKVLDCRWESDGDLLRLGMAPEEIRQRDRYVEAENEAAQKQISDQLNALAQASSMDALAAGEELKQQLAAQRGDPNAGVKYDPDRMAALKAAGDGANIPLGRFLAGLNPARVSAFWRGDVVVGPAAVPLNPGVDAGADASAEATQDRNSTGLRPRNRLRRAPIGTPLFVQFDPYLYRVNISEKGGVREFGKRPAHLISEFAPNGALAAMPFGKAVLAWDQKVPNDGDFVKLSVDPLKAKSAYTNGLYSAADLLEQAFDSTGAPIVADAFRTAMKPSELVRAGGVLSVWLDALKKSGHLATRLEDGVILVRHGGFWRLRRFEAPEEAIVPLEQKAATTDLTLDDYAGLVSKLSPEQLKPFTLPGESLARFDTTPFEKDLPALRFYASLDSGGLAQAAKDGIAYGQLNSTQRQLFDQAALEGVFVGAASVGFSAPLMRLGITGDANGLGFLMRPSVGEKGPGKALLFGLNTDQASIYNLTIKKSEAATAATGLGGG